MEAREVRVVAAVVRRRNRYLVCRRPLAKRHGGLWEFPGGKIEDHEAEIDAVRRELREELGVLAIDAGPAQIELRDAGSPYLIAFLPVRIAGRPVAREHTAVRWATLDQLLALPLAPTDRAFAQYLAAVDL